MRPYRGERRPRPWGCPASRESGAREWIRWSAWRGRLRGKPIPEPLGRGSQRQLGVHPRTAGLVDELEEPLAQLALGTVALRRVVESLGGVLARQSRRRRPALDLAGVEKGGQVLGDVGERLRLGASSLDLALDAVPVAQHLAGGLCLGLAEHVGMAAHELRAHRLGDGAEIARVALLEQQREKEHLEEHVAKLVQELLAVRARGSIGQLVAPPDGAGNYRALALLAVPGEVATKAPRDLIEPRERLRCVRHERGLPAGGNRAGAGRRSGARSHRGGSGND